jgi:hypothetical protein
MSTPSITSMAQTNSYSSLVLRSALQTGRMREVACWAHVRRKFYEVAQQQASPVALEAIARIGQLYGIETPIRGQPANIWQQVRQARAGPLMTSLHDWLHETVRALSHKSALAEAICYALVCWAVLTRYIDDRPSRLTTTRPRRCAGSRWDARIICLQDRMPAATVRRPSME